MEYRYDHISSYEFLAAGNVLYSAPGAPNFPVKLAHEIYNRCIEHSSKKEHITLYDPCCGGGYLLATVGFLNSDSIREIVGSDIDEDTLGWAQKNLSLLTIPGLNSRRTQLKGMLESYHKQVHYIALEHLERLSGIIENRTSEFLIKYFKNDILNNSYTGNFQADIIITDVPYGHLVQWSEDAGIDKMLNQLKSMSSPATITAIVHDKYQKRTHADYMRLEKFKVGKRIIEIIKLKEK